MARRSRPRLAPHRPPTRGPQARPRPRRARANPLLDPDAARCARLAIPLLIAASVAGSAWGQTTIDFGAGDSLALDQMRVITAFEDEAGNVIAPAAGTGFTMIADTGATGYLIGQGGHQTLFGDPITYDLDAEYLEQGVAGFELVGLTSPHDVTIAGLAGAFGGDPPPGSIAQFTVTDQRLLTSPTLNLGSFDGIVGMPGMDGRTVLVDLSNMTPDPDDAFPSFDLIATGFESSLADAPPPGAGRTHQFSFDRLAFDPAAGRVEPDDPLPSHRELPTMEVGVGVGDRDASGGFLFDSGAQLSLITGDTAREIGLNLDPDDPDTDIQDFLRVGGVGGQADVPVVGVDRISLTSDDGDELRFHDLLVGVIDIPGLPVDGILGFNLFTTGYLDPVLAAIEDPTSSDAQQNGAFVEMALDFSSSAWSMRLTENPDYVAAATSDFGDEQFLGFGEQALFAWPAFAIPEPGSAALLLALLPSLLRRRRTTSAASGTT